jgi:rhodanese-related sulfurtransferase
MSIKQTEVQNLKDKLDNGGDFKLIDCREQNEWDAGHIVQAEFMPLSDFENQMSKLNNKDQEIIIHCRSGKRSMDACVKLLAEGYTNLTNVQGGILAWQEEGYDVTPEE